VGALRTAPIYDFGASPYALGAAPLQPVASSGLVLTPQVSGAVIPSVKVHGFISSGISTHGGLDLAAGVMVPLVPGKLDLAVSANTGQFGGLGHPAGSKAPVVSYNGYQATLDYHPSADFDAQVSVAGTKIKGPLPYYP
jgi:hypothetical protein